MRLTALLVALFTFSHPALWGQSRRAEADYYVRVYALHYRVPLAFVRSLIEEESGWRTCALSVKGAAGLMQLMPETARRFDVRDRCDVRQNVSAGVRYLAHLISVFDGDLRLVAAAYLAGERRIVSRGLDYSNPEVIAYVRRISQRLQSAKPVQTDERKAEAPCR